MSKFKIAPWPSFNEEEIEAAKEVLVSGKVNYWTGQKSKIFEKDFALYCGNKYSIALANGSVALTCAYLSLGLKKGDEIITSPRSFVATASSAAIFGALPIFADVDIDTGCISAENIEPLITKKTKAISVVHLGGWPADMEKICKLGRFYDIPIIEDCAQAHGAKIFSENKFKSVGSFGSVSAWSFCQDKIISTGGEGGMITTDNKEIWEYIWSLKDHGKNYSLLKSKNEKKGFKWLHDSIGTNLRITEFQSAIGIKQLEKLEKTRELRNKNALFLASKLKDCQALRVPLPSDKILHAWYRLYAYLNINFLKSSWDRDRIIFEINNIGFPAFSGSCSEIYKEKCFNKNKKKDSLPNAKELGETSLAFLVHPNITYQQLELYADSICKIIKEATIN